MERLRSCSGRVTFWVSVMAGAAAVALTLATVAAGATRTDGDQGPADLQLTGTVTPTGAVGDTLTWQLTVDDYNTGPALDVWVDVTLPSNVQLTSSSTDRGTGCTSTGATTLHCSLDWLSDTAQFGHVTWSPRSPRPATGDEGGRRLPGRRSDPGRQQPDADGDHADAAASSRTCVAGHRQPGTPARPDRRVACHRRVLGVAKRRRRG
jgi:hypothetical protein